MASRVTVLVGVLLLLSSAAAAEDPFRALDLVKPNRPTPAKDFAVPGLTSPALRLSDFQGKVRFVNFWATWCPPCKEEMPSMDRLYRRYKEHGFTILAISIDTNTAAVAPFVKWLKLTFPIGLDPRMTVANDYTVRALPSSFLVDRRGTVVAVALGPRDWDSQAAHTVIDALLK